LEENGQWHQVALSKVASLEAEVFKWRASVRTIWRVKHPKVAKATFAFVEAVWSNHQLSFQVGSVLAQLLCTRLDGDKLFEHCKGLQREKNELVDKVESTAAEKDELAKVVVDLEAWLKESESKLRASKEKEVIKELEEELLVYKKEVVEQHEKGFHKAVRQARFFVKDLDLGHFYPFKDLNDDVLLDE